MWIQRAINIAVNLLWAFWGSWLGLSCAIARCLREGCRDTSWNHRALLAVQHPRVPPASSLLAEALPPSQLPGHVKHLQAFLGPRTHLPGERMLQATRKIALFLNVLTNKSINQLNTNITPHAVRGTNPMWMEIVQSGQGIFLWKRICGCDLFLLLTLGDLYLHLFLRPELAP